ncbi:hypothetical protein ABVF61_09255 [Roseibium sp. HPY-6]|uniref:hypothetical protein n=1 Tax=Roseibium sp. HPY-6 TaxID=3229852 RepID=UPI00338E37A1
MLKRLVLLLGLATGLTSPSWAVVLGGEIIDQRGNGKFVLLDTSTPFSVGADNFNTDNLYAFDEDQNILLSEPIRVDFGGDNGVIRQGETIASHYVFFDSFAGVHYGYVDFDAPILGIAAFQDTMAATDFLANNDVNYISTELRGLEPGDRVWVDSQSPNRLWVFWAGSSPGDYIRVFTEKSLGAMM